MIINKVVIHELIKEQYHPIQESNIRSVVLDGGGEAIKILVKSIVDLYGSRNNNAHFGVFKTDGSRGDFPDAFLAYSGLRHPTNEDFLTLTIDAMDSLYTNAENESASSGGYILFVDYSLPQSGRFFLIVMIKKKSGIKLSRTLEPEKLMQLDLDKIHQAARINFSKLSAYMAASEHDRLELSYLSFISKKTGESASGYFIGALGCSAGIASSKATANLIKEGVGFFRSNAYLRDFANEFKENLVGYLYQQQRRGLSVKLTEVESLARGYMPADEPNIADQLSNEFVLRLNSEEHAIPAEFPVHKPTLTKHTHIRTKTESFELKFERAALGDSDDADIFYDSENGRIIINSLPEDVKREIERELGSRIQP